MKGSEIRGGASMMAERMRVYVVKAGLPTVQEARSRLKVEIDKATQAGTRVLKVVHGYGSSGVGGALRDAIRGSLRKRRKEGKIRAFVIGEKWSVFDETARQLLEECPELEKDPDLNGYNEGITLVLI
ncbi:MAG: Smr/MutS family protein [Phycisphaerae bacterium]